MAYITGNILFFLVFYSCSLKKINKKHNTVQSLGSGLEVLASYDDLKEDSCLIELGAGGIEQKNGIFRDIKDENNYKKEGLKKIQTIKIGLNEKKKPCLLSDEIAWRGKIDLEERSSILAKTTIAVIVDNSSSLLKTDPNFERFKAIHAMLLELKKIFKKDQKKLNIKFYFSEFCTERAFTLELKSIKENIDDFIKKFNKTKIELKKSLNSYRYGTPTNRMTNYIHSLRKAMGYLKKAGHSQKILLLFSDGMPFILSDHVNQIDSCPIMRNDAFSHPENLLSRHSEIESCLHKEIFLRNSLCLHPATHPYNGVGTRNNFGLQKSTKVYLDPWNYYYGMLQMRAYFDDVVRERKDIAVYSVFLSTSDPSRPGKRRCYEREDSRIANKKGFKEKFDQLCQNFIEPIFKHISDKYYPVNSATSLSKSFEKIAIDISTKSVDLAKVPLIARYGNKKISIRVEEKETRDEQGNLGRYQFYIPPRVYKLDRSSTSEIFLTAQGRAFSIQYAFVSGNKDSCQSSSTSLRKIHQTTDYTFWQGSYNAKPSSKILITCKKQRSFPSCFYEEQKISYGLRITRSLYQKIRITYQQKCKTESFIYTQSGSCQERGGRITWNRTDPLFEESLVEKPECTYYCIGTDDGKEYEVGERQRLPRFCPETLYEDDLQTCREKGQVEIQEECLPNGLWGIVPGHKTCSLREPECDILKNCQEYQGEKTYRVGDQEKKIFYSRIDIDISKSCSSSSLGKKFSRTCTKNGWSQQWPQNLGDFRYEEPRCRKFCYWNGTKFSPNSQKTPTRTIYKTKKGLYDETCVGYYRQKQHKECTTNGWTDWIDEPTQITTRCDKGCFDHQNTFFPLGTFEHRRFYKRGMRIYPEQNCEKISGEDQSRRCVAHKTWSTEWTGRPAYNSPKPECHILKSCVYRGKSYGHHFTLSRKIYHPAYLEKGESCQEKSFQRMGKGTCKDGKIQWKKLRRNEQLIPSCKKYCEGDDHQNYKVSQSETKSFYKKALLLPGKKCSAVSSRKVFKRTCQKTGWSPKKWPSKEELGRFIYEKPTCQSVCQWRGKNYALGSHFPKRQVQASARGTYNSSCEYTFTKNQYKECKKTGWTKWIDKTSVNKNNTCDRGCFNDRKFFFPIGKKETRVRYKPNTRIFSHEHCSDKNKQIQTKTCLSDKKWSDKWTGDPEYHAIKRSKCIPWKKCLYQGTSYRHNSVFIKKLYTPVELTRVPKQSKKSEYCQKKSFLGTQMVRCHDGKILPIKPFKTNRKILDKPSCRYYCLGENYKRYYLDTERVERRIRFCPIKIHETQKASCREKSKEFSSRVCQEKAHWGDWSGRCENKEPACSYLKNCEGFLDKKKYSVGEKPETIKRYQKISVTHSQTCAKKNHPREFTRFCRETGWSEKWPEAFGKYSYTKPTCDHVCEERVDGQIKNHQLNDILIRKIKKTENGLLNPSCQDTYEVKQKKTCTLYGWTAWKRISKKHKNICDIGCLDDKTKEFYPLGTATRIRYKRPVWIAIGESCEEKSGQRQTRLCRQGNRWQHSWSGDPEYKYLKPQCQRLKSCSYEGKFYKHKEIVQRRLYQKKSKIVPEKKCEESSFLKNQQATCNGTTGKIAWPTFDQEKMTLEKNSCLCGGELGKFYKKGESERIYLYKKTYREAGESCSSASNSKMFYRTCTANGWDRSWKISQRDGYVHLTPQCDLVCKDHGKNYKIGNRTYKREEVDPGFSRECHFPFTKQSTRICQVDGWSKWKFVSTGRNPGCYQCKSLDEQIYSAQQIEQRVRYKANVLIQPGEDCALKSSQQQQRKCLGDDPDYPPWTPWEASLEYDQKKPSCMIIPPSSIQLSCVPGKVEERYRYKIKTIDPNEMTCEKQEQSRQCLKTMHWGNWSGDPSFSSDQESCPLFRNKYGEDSFEN